jgi:hypothetical protein
MYDTDDPRVAGCPRMPGSGVPTPDYSETVGGWSRVSVANEADDTDLLSGRLLGERDDEQP